MKALAIRFLGNKTLCESCGNSIAGLRMQVGNPRHVLEHEPDIEAFLLCWQCVPPVTVTKTNFEGKTITKLWQTT